MKEFYYFMGGVASLFVAQLIFNYNFSDWVKDKVIALIAWIKGKLSSGEAAVKAEVTTLKKKL